MAKFVGNYLLHGYSFFKGNALNEVNLNVVQSVQIIFLFFSLMQLPFADMASAAFTFLVRMSRNDWAIKKFTDRAGKTMTQLLFCAVKCLDL
jgi:hypothetical protein